MSVETASSEPDYVDVLVAQNYKTSGVCAHIEGEDETPICELGRDDANYRYRTFPSSWVEVCDKCASEARRRFERDA